MGGSAAGAGAGSIFRGSGQLWQSYWKSLISATVENAQPTHVVLTFPSAKTSLIASDFTIAGFTISSASWTGAVLTLVLSTAVVYGDSLVVTFVTTGQTKSVTNNVSATAEYQAILAVLTGTIPNIQTRRAQNEFVKYIKGGNPDLRNVLAKLACIIPYMWGMPTASDSLFWLNNPARKATLSVTPPTYTKNKGFTGDGVAAYIDTTFNPSVDGEDLYTQNDNCQGYWFLNERTTDALLGSGIVGGMGVFPLHNGSVYAYVQGGGGYLASPSPSVTTKGLFTAVRTSATLINGYFNKTIFGADLTKASAALQNLTAFNLAMNNAGNPTYYQSETIGLVYYGSSLDATDVKVIVDACTNLFISLLTLNITYSDSLSGTTIDTDKWTVTNPDPTKVEFSQNNGIMMNEVGLVAGPIFSNKIQSNLSQLYGIWEFDVINMIAAGITNTTAYTGIGLFGASTGVYYNHVLLNFVRWNNITEGYYFRIYDNGTSICNVLLEGVLDMGKFRFVATPFSDYKLYRYVNDAWVQQGLTYNRTLPELSLFMTSPGNNECLTFLNDVKIYSL